MLGSRALASLWKEQGENIVAMVNADMLGYQATSEVGEPCGGVECRWMGDASVYE